jgi:hypothetical protein
VKGLDSADAVEVKQLRARVAELDAREPERVEVSVLDAEDRGGLSAIAEDIHLRAQDLRETADRIVAAIDRLEGPVPAHPAAPEPRERPRPISAAASAPREAPVRAAERRGDGELGGGPMRMLTALAGTRDRRATRVQFGMLAGFSCGGGTFAKYLSILRTTGLVTGTVRRSP